jgi:ferritin
MPSQTFIARLTEQVGNEIAASQQYAQVAIHYDAETLPRLAAFFHAQALEERNHAMMMVQYLLDAGSTPRLPATPAPVADFEDIVAPVRLALDQERRVTEQINGLAGLAREDGDYTSEQFLQWFLKEQVEEVATMSDLLTVVTRARENPLLAEEYLAREGLGGGGEGADPTAPPVAGGAL